MPSTRKSKPSFVRPGRGIEFLKKSGGLPPRRESRRRTRYAYTPPRRRQPPRNLCDVPLSGWCRIQGCYTLAQHGMSDIPQSAVEELANFCDVSSSRELRTNPPVIDGSTKPWNAGGVATSPEGRCAGSCSLEGLAGVSHPVPRPALPCLLPTWQGVPI